MIGLVDDWAYCNYFIWFQIIYAVFNAITISHLRDIWYDADFHIERMEQFVDATVFSVVYAFVLRLFVSLPLQYAEAVQQLE